MALRLQDKFRIVNNRTKKAKAGDKDKMRMRSRVERLEQLHQGDRYVVIFEENGQRYQLEDCDYSQEPSGERKRYLSDFEYDALSKSDATIILVEYVQMDHNRGF